jgi:hypothetical protein
VTADERKQRGTKSAVIVERLVRGQLRAMGCDRFDLGSGATLARASSAHRAGAVAGDSRGAG